MEIHMFGISIIIAPAVALAVISLAIRIVRDNIQKR